MKYLYLLPVLFLLACDDGPPSSDQLQSASQESILMEATKEVGMPAIHKFFERRELKDIYELRDQASLTTYTYVWSDMKGEFTFFCNSIGYGIPYATQFTSPMKVEWNYINGVRFANVVPQADPNGLFSPSSAEGTWILCKDPNGTQVKPVYVELRVIVSPFDLVKKPKEPSPSQTPVAHGKYDYLRAAPPKD